MQGRIEDFSIFTEKARMYPKIGAGKEIAGFYLGFP
jgi:hypothetical protein